MPDNPPATASQEESLTAEDIEVDTAPRMTVQSLFPDGDDHGSDGNFHQHGNIIR